MWQHKCGISWILTYSRINYGVSVKQCLSCPPPVCCLACVNLLCNHTLNQVQSFKYLGRTENEQSTQEEIKNRIAKYSQNVGCMYRLLKDRNVPKKAKQIIHQTILRHILIFGSECWTLTKRLEQQITTAAMKVIRMIQGVTRWDRKINEDCCIHRTYTNRVICCPLFK